MCFWSYLFLTAVSAYQCVGDRLGNHGRNQVANSVEKKPGAAA